MSEMSDSSAENDEFQFYLLLVRQYIFQLPEEDERVRAAAWMVHLRRIRDARDLKLRNDYIKLLLFSMHSRCLIGPFAQPPQKDKGLENFPQNFSFPDMMRHLIEESNTQSMRYCQSKHEDQSPLASRKGRVKDKVQETSEDNVSLPKTSLSQTKIHQYNIEDNFIHKQCQENFVAETTTSWVPGLTTISSPFSLDLKVENLIKVKNENIKEHQSAIDDAAIKKEEPIGLAADTYQKQQFMQDADVSVRHPHDPINNLLTHGENSKHFQKICNELHDNTRMLRNTREFTDEINVAHNIDEKNTNNEKYRQFNHSDNAWYQHCHHHHHKPQICHNNEHKTSAQEMGVMGRKYIGQLCPQMPMNGGMTTYPKQDFSVYCEHRYLGTNSKETIGKLENNTCQLNENAYNNLRTNQFQTDYDHYTTNLCNRQTQENCKCSQTMSTITENTHSCPFEFNNRKSRAEHGSRAEAEDQSASSDDIMQTKNVKQRNKAGIRNGFNTTGNSEQNKPVTYGSESIHTLNMKQCSCKKDPQKPTEEQLFSLSKLELPPNGMDELCVNKVSIRQQKSHQDVHLQGLYKQSFHGQTGTQGNMSINQRHPQSTEDVPTDMIKKAKSSEFNVSLFRASLSADLGAYSTGYAAGYSAGYAAGIEAALHSSPEHLHSVLH